MHYIISCCVCLSSSLCNVVHSADKINVHKKTSWSQVSINVNLFVTLLTLFITPVMSIWFWAIVRTQGDDTSPSLARLFHIGQLLPCYVLAVEGGTRVSLSVNPRLVNTHLTHRDIKPGMVIMNLCILTCTINYHTCKVASYPGVPMFFNVCKKNQEGLVDLVM